MEDQTSDQVVIPDMSEPLTNESESNQNLPSEEHQTVAVTAVEAVPVTSAIPVTLPVGSLINVSGSGTTFNVITPDQLQVSWLVAVDLLEGCFHSSCKFICSVFNGL